MRRRWALTQHMLPTHPRGVLGLAAGADVAAGLSSLLASLHARCAGAELGPGIGIVGRGFHRQVAVPFIARATIRYKRQNFHDTPPAFSHGLTAGVALLTL